ncbi:glycosyltransferase family 4 protein [Chloroflexi bacterium TSY]|nr:glycosyltransferase family 4 protein [Chloroflexi bacterium TSY]
MAAMHKVLFIAYNFPPHGGAGVQRSTKFVKYLSEFAWQPIIITATSDASSVHDYSLLNDVPESVAVHRVPGFSIARFQKQAGKIKLQKAAVLVNLLLQTPDALQFWARQTRWPIQQIIQQEEPLLIYTTSGPYSSHLVGLWVKKRFGLPWFADFRDPWSQNLLIPYLPGYRTLNRFIERRVLANADRVACVSDAWLMALYDNLGREKEKFVLLPNGYDEDDIHPLPPPVRADRFTLLHAGSFYHNRRPKQILEAVEHLVENGHIPREQLRVIFIGKNARDHVPEAPPFEVHDYMPHKELERFRKEAHVLLLLLAATPENVGNLSGKIYEYLAANRPILGIVPPGGAAQALIEETRTGITVGGDVEAIARAIETLFRRWQLQQNEWSPNWNAIHQYTRKRLTERLATEFANLIQRL